MTKTLRYTLLAGLMLLLLTFGSCTRPETSTPPASGTEVGSSPVTVENPTGPTNTDGAETILIPAGTFLMGSADSDALADEDEKPGHTVTLDGFYLYTHEVTNEQYAACVAAGVCPAVRELASGPTSHTSDPAYAQYPVVGVTWKMADAYCTWVGGRLPTEAEWEYAARGTDSLLHPWGADDPACDRTNMDGCQTPPMTMAVGSYLLGNSPFGVWDMSGNVWEWTQDWYAEAFYTFSSAVNPLGPGAAQDTSNPLKVVRGGGWNSGPEQMRSAARLGVNPYRAYNDVGFRCVAQPALELSENYQETETRFEVPDEDGEIAEEPETPTENFYDIVHSSATCPDVDGQVHIEITILVPPGTTFSLSVFDIPFACTYDEATHTLKCDGAAAPQYYETHKTLMDFYINYPNGETEYINWYNIPIPDDCGSEGHINVGETTANVSCPVDGFVTVTFTYDPSITWKDVYLRSMDTPLPCEEIGEGVLVCTAPDITEGGFYEFYLEDEGPSHKWWPNVPAPEGCQAATQLEITTTTLCFLGTIPTAEFFYDPAPHGNVKTVEDGGEFRLHVNWSAGVTESMFTDETPGHVTTMTLCFQDDYCQDVPDITVPACPGDEGNDRGYTIDPICYAPSESDPFSPAVSIQYWPTDEMLADVTGDDTPLTCDEMGEGWFACYTVPGEAGASAEIEFCLENGECYNEFVEVRDCPTPTTYYTTCQGGDDGPPRFHLLFDPDFMGVVSVSDGGVQQTCEEVSLGHLSCTFQNSTPGTETTMTILTENGSSIDIPNVYTPLCGATSEWTLAGAGCHPVPEPNHIAFMVDTGYEWLVDGTEVEYTATDGIRTYACITHPLVPGRIYCHGIKPEVPATLNLCLQQPGQPAECHTFSDYYDWVSYLTCPEPVVCSSFTDKATCQSNGCNWEVPVGPAGGGTGHCE